jgi:hypothetical protein
LNPSTKSTKVEAKAKPGRAFGTLRAGWKPGNKNRSARVGKMAAGGTCVEKTQALGRQSWAGAQLSIKNQQGRNEVGHQDLALKEPGGETKMEQDS